MNFKRYGLYANKLENLKEINKFLEKEKLTQVLTSFKVIGSIIKKPFIALAGVAQCGS